MTSTTELRADIAARLAARISLGVTPTPFDPAPRFSAAIGAEVWIKRDDVGPIGLVGNKVRKLEYLAADALAQNATVLVTVGARQSNHARTTAAVAARLGLRCVLILGGDEPPLAQGNHLLDRLFGAEIEFAGDETWAVLDARLAERCAALTGRGERPYPIPMGGSIPVGVLGLTRGYIELTDQLASLGLDAQVVYHASSSGGTQAGMTLGQALVGGGPSIRGVDVAKVPGGLEHKVSRLANAAAEALGVEARWRPEDIDIDHGQVGPGYAVPTDASARAARLLAETEGIVADPVYSAKALAALVLDAGAGKLRGGQVVFWHTGGSPALFDSAFASWGAPSRSG